MCEALVREGGREGGGAGAANCICTVITLMLYMACGTYFWSSRMYEFSSRPLAFPGESEAFAPSSETGFSAGAGTAVTAAPALAFFLRALLDSPGAAPGGFATTAEDIVGKCVCMYEGVE